MARSLSVNRHHPEPAVLQEALAVLRRGGVVAFPTDTVYGLAVAATYPGAIRQLYAVKQRPVDKALPVIIGTLEQLSGLVLTPSCAAAKLMAAFWPGPLTLLLEPLENVPMELRGSSARLGVRWPQCILCQQLAIGLGGAITATSANLSGAPAALNAHEVMAQFASTVELILDGGPASNPDVSTVLDAAVDPPRLVRPGRVAQAAIEAVLGYALVPVSDTVIDRGGMQANKAIR